MVGSSTLPVMLIAGVRPLALHVPSRAWVGRWDRERERVRYGGRKSGAGKRAVERGRQESSRVVVRRRGQEEMGSKRAVRRRGWAVSQGAATVGGEER